MKISLLLSALALTVVLALSGQDGQEGPDLPDGEGKDLVIDACTSCHGLNQVAANTGTEEDWGGVVYNMRVQGLDVTPEEALQIVAYLAKAFPPAKKIVAPLPDGEAKDLVMERCAGCHDLARVQEHTGTKDNWDGVVKYMISLGMPAKPKEDAQIVAYLAKNFPPPLKEGTGKEAGKAPEPAKPPTPPSNTPAPSQGK